MKNSITLPAVLFSAVLLLAVQHATAITIDTVPVGNVGNANDPATGNLYGGVSYAYFIGTYEVTNTQYAWFLNSKAGSDPLSLWDTSMGFDVRGGITRSGSSPNFRYEVKVNMADKPVNFVTWYDAARFANWLDNGQGSGDTETGAYTLLGGTSTPTDGLSITRNGGATWFLPSENEWYKAAYYDPGSSSYFAYPTRSNTVPVGGPSPGGSNSANYFDSGLFTSTDVGAYDTSRSPCGTFDQGGNLYEMTETHYSGIERVYRGGAFNSDQSHMLASRRFGFLPSTPGGDTIGFRVASIITISPPLTGDYDGNGGVDARDYVVWRKNVGNVVPPGTNGDANGNGFVENAEYQPWRANYGRIASTTGSGAGLNAGGSTPEPASLTLSVVGVMILLARRRA